MPGTHQRRPDYVFHPGETLAETLGELSMTQKQLSERTGRPLKTINEIIKGRAAIIEDNALADKAEAGGQFISFEESLASHSPLKCAAGGGSDRGWCGD